MCKNGHTARTITWSYKTKLQCKHAARYTVTKCDNKKTECYRPSLMSIIFFNAVRRSILWSDINKHAAISQGMLAKKVCSTKVRSVDVLTSVGAFSSFCHADTISHARWCLLLSMCIIGRERIPTPTADLGCRTYIIHCLQTEASRVRTWSLIVICIPAVQCTVSR